MVRIVSIVVLAALTAVGCTAAPTTPSPNVPYSQTDIRVGTGAEAVNGGTLTVSYTGWLYDPSRPENKGLQFDSSVGSATPFTFILGSGQVIDGWDQGVPGMKVGGVRRLVIPPSLGYGGFRNGSIPANATLLFEVELLDVQ